MYLECHLGVRAHKAGKVLYDLNGNPARAGAGRRSSRTAGDPDDIMSISCHRHLIPLIPLIKL